MIDQSAINKLRKQIGKEFRAEKERQQLTSYALAKMAGIAQQQLDGIEDGSKSYTIDSLIRVVKALNYLPPSLQNPK